MTAAGAGPTSWPRNSSTRDLASPNQVDLPRHHVKRHINIVGDFIVPPDGFDAPLVAMAAFKGAVDDQPLAHSMIAIRPAHGDMDK